MPPQKIARTAQEFLADLRQANPARIHVGHDFRFGTQQSGDVTLLAQAFDVLIAEPVACKDGETVSSTRIRALRAAGRLAEADALQGPCVVAQPLAG